MLSRRVLQFRVIGLPQPAGSKRAFPNPKTGGMIVTDANPNTKLWQAMVTDAAHEAMLEDEQELYDGPLALTLRFYLTRPKGHYGKRGLRPSAPEFPAVRPDALKLARGVEDACTGTVWRDDAQIIQEEILKLYGDPARVEVEVYDLTSRSGKTSPVPTSSESVSL